MPEREAGQVGEVGGVVAPTPPSGWMADFGEVLWNIFNANQIALQEAVYGSLVWRDEQWMYRRRRYPEWWAKWLEVKEQIQTVCEMLEDLEMPRPEGEEYFEPANLPADVAAHIEGLKDPSKVTFRICGLVSDAQSKEADHA